MCETNFLPQNALVQNRMGDCYNLLQMNSAVLLCHNEDKSGYAKQNSNVSKTLYLKELPPKGKDGFNVSHWAPQGSKHVILASTSEMSRHAAEGILPQTSTRAKRIFVPNENKDTYYWMKRLKNNVSARRSRVKRKLVEQYMEKKLVQLQTENYELKKELENLKKIYGYSNEVEQVSGVQAKVEILDDYDEDNTCDSGKQENLENKIFASDNEQSSTGSSDDNDTQTENFRDKEGGSDIQKIPHKFRLKVHLHSAFNGVDTYQKC